MDGIPADAEAHRLRPVDFRSPSKMAREHVRSLESFLGREIFLRKTRALELTEAGANYLPIVREAFDLIASGTQAFIGGDQGRHAVLQCNLAFSIFWLAPRLHRLYATHPWLVLNIVTPIWDPERHAAQATMEIRFGRPDAMSPTAERIMQDNYFPVCAPDYQEGCHDLETATLFDCAGVTGSWDTWCASQGLPFDRSKDVNLGSTYAITITAALSGAGMTMAHDCLVEDLLAQGRLIQPFEHAPSLTEGYYFIAPSTHATTPASTAFQDWLRSEI